MMALPAQIVFAQSGDTTSAQTIEGDIFVKVDIEASVDASQWRKHLEANLGPAIEHAAKKGMKAGTYTVYVRFLVEKDGSISNVKARNNPGFGLAKASENVIKSGPKWKPGMQNGRIVRSYHTQPITFVLTEE